MSSIEHSEIKPPAQTCSICLEDVDADDKMNNGVPNCVTCKNGHYLHRECFDKMSNNKCPQCREDVVYNCHGYHHGYIQPIRKGGRIKKKVTKKRKSIKKKKMTRKRKSIRK